MLAVMRRYALLALAALLMYSCASTGDQGVEDETAPVEQTPSEISEPAPEAEAGTAAGEQAGEPGAEVPVSEEPSPSEEVGPEVEEAAAVPELIIEEPANTSRVVDREFAVRATVSDGTLASLEIELLAGPIVTSDYAFVDLSTLPAELRKVELELRGERTVIRLPNGLVDGEEYTWRARGVSSGGGVVDWTEPGTTLLDLGFGGPDWNPALPTIDTTPSVSWKGADIYQGYQVTVTDRLGARLTDTLTRGTEFSLPEVEPGRYRVYVRALRTDGFATRQSGPLLVRVLDDAAPQPAWPRGGETSLSSRVGLHWSPVVGAVSYEARYRETGSEEWISLDPTREPFVAVEPAAAGGQFYEWQARAMNEAGRLFSWSESTGFQVGDFALDFVPVVGVGDQARFARGYDGGSRDESPVRDIVLTVPYEMNRTPLTNEQVARLVNYALERGMVTADESGVYLTQERIVPLIGLAQMDYGQQLGLVYQGGRIGVESGYERHPAVGITWHGAVQIANALSYVEGRTASYDGTGSSWDEAADGYRLPTEAEWEYAARGTTTRLYPWSGTLSGRVANYYRSFDPFEDVNEPFTGAGGPTTPVGFFSGRAVSGFQTVSDASPFGIRDLVGNVWEWCWDRYDPGYYAASPDTDPTGPEESDFATGNEAIVLAVALDPNQRVVRGVAWNSRAPDVRLTNRGRYTELGRSYSIGVRLVRYPLP